MDKYSILKMTKVGRKVFFARFACKHILYHLFKICGAAFGGALHPSYPTPYPLGAFSSTSIV
jgi:hypothetical protein